MADPIEEIRILHHLAIHLYLIPIFVLDDGRKFKVRRQVGESSRPFEGLCCISAGIAACAGPGYAAAAAAAAKVCLRGDAAVWSGDRLGERCRDGRRDGGRVHGRRRHNG